MMNAGRYVSPEVILRGHLRQRDARDLLIPVISIDINHSIFLPVGRDLAVTIKRKGPPATTASNG